MQEYHLPKTSSVPLADMSNSGAGAPLPASLSSSSVQLDPRNTLVPSSSTSSLILGLSGFNNTPPTGQQLLKKMNITQRWRNGELSNFSYLMWLNTLAGRSYNDITQYPVFPWIIADYESKHLDLSRPETYRDLSKPIGALNPQRLQQFIERAEAFDDPSIPKFLYGSHYSNVGVVLNYLVRQEPFTSYYLQLQGGKFDHPSRMFLSMADTWKNCMTNPSDVKELIPEFFYQPEFLRNSNEFCFGLHPHTGVPIMASDVVLPPWANNDPHRFIHIQQQALESDYVSANLHHWIDLIFGYKQRDEPARQAFNVFYHLTYEGVVNIDAIEDPVERRSIEAQIANFGQTPSQLFDKPHPQKKLSPLASSLSNINLPGTNVNNFSNVNTSSSNVRASVISGSSSNSISQPVVSRWYDLLPVKTSKPIIYVRYSGNPGDHRLVYVTLDGVVSANNIFHPNKVDKQNQTWFSFEPDKTLQKQPKRLHMLYPEPVAHPSRCFAISRDAKWLFSCAMWADDIQAHQLTGGSGAFKKLDQAEHRDLVTCMMISDDGSILVSGSKDCTIVVWYIDPQGISGGKSALASLWTGKRKLAPGTSNQLFRLKRILYGHTDRITTLDFCVELDLVLSGSRDCSVILSSLQKGKYIRSIFHPYSITLVKISPSCGRFVVYCEENLQLYFYSVNGDLLARRKTVLKRVLFMMFTPDGQFFITAGVGDTIVVRSVPQFDIVHVFEAGETVFCLDYIVGNNDHDFLISSLLSGQLRLFTFDSARFTSLPVLPSTV